MPTTKPLDIQKLLRQHLAARKEAQRAAGRGMELVKAGRRAAAKEELRRAEAANAKAEAIERIMRPAPSVYDLDRKLPRRR